MSIIIIVFPGAPKPTKEAIDEEERINASIIRRMEGCLTFFYCFNDY